MSTANHKSTPQCLYLGCLRVRLTHFIHTSLYPLALDVFVVLNGTSEGIRSSLLGILSLHLAHLLCHILHRPACVSSLEDHVLITSCIALSVARTASNTLF